MTGVQTCALPIFCPALGKFSRVPAPRHYSELAVSGRPVGGGDDFPDFFGRAHILEDVQIFRADGPLFHQRLEIDDLVPESAAEQEHRNGPDLARLDRQAIRQP